MEGERKISFSVWVHNVPLCLQSRLQISEWFTDKFVLQVKSRINVNSVSMQQPRKLP